MKYFSYLLITIFITINNPLFSYCQSNNENICLKFKNYVKFNNSRINVKLKDIIIDKFSNKYLLLNEYKKENKNLIIKKLDKNNVLIWENTIKNIEGINILKNSKNEIYITSYYTKSLKLEINNKKIEIKSNHTKSLLILTLDTQTGKIINYLNISTNYGVEPYISKINKENNLYITGYYGGKSDFFEKKGFEDGFLLVLDSNLKKLWSKSINRKYSVIINDIKIGINNIYLRTNKKKLYKIDKKNKEIIEILKTANIKSFDIDKNENIYAVTHNDYLKKFDKKGNLILTNNLNDFDYIVTPSEIKVENNSLFIKYFAKIEYRNNIIISKYNLELKNIWHNAILGSSSFNGYLKIFNKNIYLFGDYDGDLKLSDKISFYNLYISNFLFEFKE